MPCRQAPVVHLVIVFGLDDFVDEVVVLQLAPMFGPFHRAQLTHELPRTLAGIMHGYEHPRFVAAALGLA